MCTSCSYVHSNTVSYCPQLKAPQTGELATWDGKYSKLKGQVEKDVKSK